ncbi:hypothetical protein [Blastococcus sp. PRF04-17]|uniref:hypothetical protein n=1 Tax=Blastococcus sp. PRF04-17 TaxID=2933797 RepID=UPI00352FF314
MCSDGSGDVLAALEADLDALAAQDLKGMFGPQVLERLGRLVRASNRLTAQLTRHVREGELTQAAEHDGKKTMQSWLRGHALLAPAAAGQLVRTGRALELLPAVAAGFAAGAITADAVAVIARSPVPSTWPPPQRPASTSPGWTGCWPRSPPPSSPANSPRWCSATWPTSIPTARSRTPPRGGRCRSSSMPTVR